MIKERGLWTPEEDALISMLYEQKHIQDWNEIARLARDEYHFPQKNSRLYKDRYMTHISPSIFKIDWSHEEELLFMKLHNQIGNKWATIAQHLTGKTDNCVKNHFYSKLRKLLRKLNKIIQFYLKKQFRPIDISIMYKIVQAAEERFKQKPNCQDSVSRECLSNFQFKTDVENKMLQSAMFKDANELDEEDELKYTTSHIEEYKDLIKEIYRVSKLYKRKSKKVRNSLIQAPANHSRKKNRKDQVKVDDDENSNSSKQNRVYQSKKKVSTTILVRKNVFEDSEDSEIIKKEENQAQDLEEKNDKKNAQSNVRIQVEQGDGIQQLLRTAGILHDEVKQSNKTKNEKNTRKYLSSQYNVSSLQGSNDGPQQSFLGTSSFDYSPMQSFSSQQMQSFLGFPMGNSGNNYANFTLSQKSSFKSYSERDPSQIDNPFFDEYSSGNGHLMFPMNFTMPAAHQYQQAYHPLNESHDGGYSAFDYPNIIHQHPQQEGNDQKLNAKETKN